MMQSTITIMMRLAPKELHSSSQ